MKGMKLKIVRLKWRDMMTYCERHPLSKASTAECATLNIVGFLISEDDEVIRLAHICCNIPDTEEVTFSDYSVIPQDGIIERVNLTEE